MKSPAVSAVKRPLWQFLVPPMLLLSLGLHGLLLFVPTSPSEDDLLPPPDPEDEGIAVIKIDPPATSLPAPAATPRTGSAATQSGGTTNQQAQGRGNAGGNQAANRGTARAGGTPNRGGGQTASSSGGSASRRGDRDRAAAPATNDRVSVPDLGDEDDSAAPPPRRSQTAAVENPNPAAPDVAAIARQARIQFLSYVDTFASYQGNQPPSAAEVTERRTLWLSSFTDQGAPYDDLAIQPLQLSEKLPYEAGICLPGAPNPGQALVLVEADGTLNPDVMLLQSTGYRKFNEAMTTLIQGHDYPAAAVPQAYLVEVAVEYEADDCDWPPQVEALPDEYFTLLRSYRGPGLTTLAEAEAAQAAWVAAGDRPAAQPLAGFDERVPYPDNICLPIAPVESRWGVVVSPEGEVQGEVEPLRSTGYQWFDDRAQAIASNTAFPSTGATQTYILTIPTGYNPVNCQKLDSQSFNVGGAAANTPPATPASAATAIAADPAQQEELLQAGRERVIADALGSLNGDAALAAAVVDSGWPDDLDRACFLAAADGELAPAEKASDVVILSQNAERAPASLAELYQVQAEAAGEYCGAPLYELRVDGTVQLFASVVGFGAGNSNALVVLWPADPQ